MSYNNIKVNSTKADQSGEITLNTTNLIEYKEAGINCILRKDSTGWSTKSTLASQTGFLNWGATTNPGNTSSTYKYDVGDNIITRKAGNEYDYVDNNITLVNSSGSYVPVSNTSWTMGYTLDGNYFNGKTVLLKALVSLTYYSGSSIVLQWHDGTGDITTTNALGARSYGNVNYGSFVYGIYTGDGTTRTVSIKVVDVTGTVVFTAGARAYNTQITIKEIG